MASKTVPLILAFLGEHFGNRARPRAHTPKEAFRHYDYVRPVLSLNMTYYPARGERGYVLIPKDEFLEAAEALLQRVTEA